MSRGYYPFHRKGAASVREVCLHSLFVARRVERNAYQEAVDRMVPPKRFRDPFSRKFRAAVRDAERHLHACHVLDAVYENIIDGVESTE